MLVEQSATLIDATLQWLSNSAIGMHVAEDAITFPLLETGHVICLALVFGSILLVDLRLMGLAARDYPLRALTRSVLPVTWLAFAGAVVTGSLLFASNPYGYYENTAFRVKICLLLLAGVNMAIFHVVTGRGRRSDRAGPPPASARIAGFASLLIWLGIVASGRWIGFTMSPF